MPRTETTTRTIYKYDELNDEQRQRAIDGLRNINVAWDWWDFIYEDAKNVGIKITGFDIDRGSYCDIEIDDVLDTAHAIEKEHGEGCDTYKTTQTFLRVRDDEVDRAPKDGHGELVNEYALDQHLDQLEADYKKMMSECYLSVLRQEFEYLTSDEAIIEIINANKYEFTEYGGLA